MITSKYFNVETRENLNKTFACGVSLYTIVKPGPSENTKRTAGKQWKCESRGEKNKKHLVTRHLTKKKNLMKHKLKMTTKIIRHFIRHNTIIRNTFE